MDATVIPPPPAAVPPRSITGPLALTSVGTLLLAAAQVLGLLVAQSFLAVLPTGVLASDGTPGPDAVAYTAVPGVVTAVLERGRHDVFLVVDADHAHTGLLGPVEVVGPDGQRVAVDDAPGVSINASRADRRAFNVAAFDVTTPGEHAVVLPRAATPGAVAVVAEGMPTWSFARGVLGTVAGTFAVVGLAAVGLAVTAGGVAWWARRAPARRLPSTAEARPVP